MESGSLNLMTSSHARSLSFSKRVVFFFFFSSSLKHAQQAKLMILFTSFISTMEVVKLGRLTRYPGASDSKAAVKNLKP